MAIPVPISGYYIQAALDDARIGDPVAIFTGFIDMPSLTYSAGRKDSQLVARGVYGQMLGETAYTPATTLDWKGQTTWFTNFQAQGQPVDALAVYNDEGYWIAERMLSEIRHNLKCTASGAAVIPQQWNHQDMVFGARFKTDGDAGLVFYIDNDELYATDRWQAGWEGDTTFYIAQMVAGVRTVVASGTQTGYSQGDEILMQVSLEPGRIQAWWWKPNDAPDPSQYVEFAAWDVDGSETSVPPNRYAVGIFSELEAEEETHFYEVWAADGGYPMTIQEMVATIANIAGVTATGDTHLYGSSDEVQVSSVDLTVELGGIGDSITMFDAVPGAAYSPQLQVNTFFMTLLDGAAAEISNPSPLCRSLELAGSAEQRVVRVVAHGDWISIYQNYRLVGALHYRMPRHGFYVRCPGASWWQMDHCYQPLQATDSQWVAWDAGQPANSILQTILDRRRIYLLERPDGTLRIMDSQETGDILIGPENPVGSNTYYRTTLISHGEQQDRREQSAILGLTDVNGFRVYLLDTMNASHSRKVVLRDSPWAANEQEALREITLQLQDQQRLVDRRMLTMFCDPAMEPGDRFYILDEHFPDDPYTYPWIVLAKTFALTFGEGEINHAATVQAAKYIEQVGPSAWGNAYWGESYWGGPFVIYS
jgi:hypothetical protein